MFDNATITYLNIRACCTMVQQTGVQKLVKFEQIERIHYTYEHNN